MKIQYIENSAAGHVAFLSVTEAAKRLTISRRHYYVLVQRGEVPAPIDVFGVKRVSADAIERIIQAKLAVGRKVV